MMSITDEVANQSIFAGGCIPLHWCHCSSSCPLPWDLVKTINSDDGVMLLHTCVPGVLRSMVTPRRKETWRWIQHLL